MSKRKWFRPLWKSKHHHHRYEPFYDEHSDYNTNSKSYYDYLARFNSFLRMVEDFINRLMDRNVQVKNTPSITISKKGDWIDNGECEPNNYDDEIELSANVNISSSTETQTLNHTTLKSFTISNGTKIKNDGVWSPDYLNMIKEIDSEIGKIKTDILDLDERVTNNERDIGILDGRVTKVENDLTSLTNKVNTNTTNINHLTNALQKILTNLHSSGAITNSNMINYEFKPNRKIASGNINLFGGTSDGNSFIRTSDAKTENDITSGY